MAIVGESGSGKSVTRDDADGPDARARTRSFEGDACFEGTGADPRDRTTSCSRSAARAIAMVFQDPMSSLDPVYRIGKQIVEQIRVHEHERQQGGRRWTARSS